jgi:uncharacterized protein YraI
MTSRAHRWRWLIALGFALTAGASAQTAYTTQDVNVRAGPGRDYPLVAWLTPGVQVTVAGCLDTWKWCDVIVGPNRGWVYARFLAYPYQNQNVPIISSGPMIGLPIVTFSIVPYWNNYYRGRPWYADRPHWQHPHPPAVRPPPPGPKPPPVLRPPPRPRPPPPVTRPPPKPRPPPPVTRPPPRPNPPSGGNPPPRPRPPAGGGPPAGGKPPPMSRPTPRPAPATQ